jgi:quercetin dioxygenase-like cupin family protein
MAATQGAPASAHAGMAGSVLLAGTGLAVADSEAQQPGVRRSPVLQQDLVLARGQAVQVRVDFDVAAVSARHSHPGEEIAYVLKGVLEYTLEGARPVTLLAGEAFFIPAGMKHVARNVGPGSASALATYLVRKGRPLMMLPREGSR